MVRRAVGKGWEGLGRRADTDARYTPSRSPRRSGSVSMRVCIFSCACNTAKTRARPIGRTRPYPTRPRSRLGVQPSVLSRLMKCTIRSTGRAAAGKTADTQRKTSTTTSPPSNPRRTRRWRTSDRRPALACPDRRARWTPAPPPRRFVSPPHHLPRERSVSSQRRVVLSALQTGTPWLALRSAASRLQTTRTDRWRCTGTNLGLAWTLIGTHRDVHSAVSAQSAKPRGMGEVTSLTFHTLPNMDRGSWKVACTSARVYGGSVRTLQQRTRGRARYVTPRYFRL